MKTAFISDIHANIDALQCVFDDITQRNISSIICLGDVIGYGPRPNECVAAIRSQCEVTLMGNHDSAVFAPTANLNFNANALHAIVWTSTVISQDSLEFLNSLPLTYTKANYTAVHATPYDPYQWFYISSVEDALFNFNFFKTKFCFNGHTHVPGIIELNGDSHNIRIYKDQEFFYNQKEDFRYIVNVGSVGQPRDGDSRACYVILDTDIGSLEYVRLSYDLDAYKKKMHDAEMPEFLIQRIEQGR
ncbi:metallophosphoesterase family protein [Chitinivibrio alkaliphilus]|uniref:Metallophosphoesterase n=1 Tax=Chitinivibrio alkaliphilus ACht1 TaxID=1313304 RepID=U7D8F1_9BACT|nr:metallophosphoesterase family protein [Chitinivibrio alkaliphilus]ERP31352.1 metallophosphoesterase [Chitinivibrio alkaliphilus ACht1]